MPEFAFKEKITKKAFGAKLIKEFGYDNLSCSPYSENTRDEDGNLCIGNRMTLFYVDNVHIGTWMKGEGWIFKKGV